MHCHSHLVQSNIRCDAGPVGAAMAFEQDQGTVDYDYEHAQVDSRGWD